MRADRSLIMLQTPELSHDSVHVEPFVTNIANFEFSSELNYALFVHEV